MTDNMTKNATDVGAMSLPENRRRQKRKYMLFKIPAYDARTRRFLGLVQDINEIGVQLVWVKVEVNSTKHMIVQVADFGTY